MFRMNDEILWVILFATGKTIFGCSLINLNEEKWVVSVTFQNQNHSLQVKQEHMNFRHKWRLCSYKRRRVMFNMIHLINTFCSSEIKDFWTQRNPGGNWNFSKSRGEEKEGKGELLNFHWGENYWRWNFKQTTKFQNEF